MLKTFKLLFVQLLFSLLVNAQISQIAESPVFEEPEKGILKLIQFRNGYTVYCHKSGSNVSIQIYNEQHKKTVDTKIETSFGLDDAGMFSLFEVNSDLAIFFIFRFKDEAPKIYRVVVDGKNGKIKSEQKICELNKIPKRGAIAMSFNSGSSDPSFNVITDPASGNYATVTTNPVAIGDNNRLEITLYNNSHQQIAKSFKLPPTKMFEYIRFLDMVFVGKDSVAVLLNGFNSNRYENRINFPFIATLASGRDSLIFSPIEVDNDQFLQLGTMRYNPFSKKIIILAPYQTRNINDFYYYPFLMFFDPFNQKLDSYSKYNVPDEAYAANLDVLGKKNGANFAVAPQNLYVHKDGTFTIVNEQMTAIAQRDNNRTLLGTLCAVTYKPDGKALISSVIPKAQWIEGKLLPPLYSIDRDRSPQYLFDDDQYKSFYFLEGPSAKYLLFNDFEENEYVSTKGKLANVRNVNGCDAFYFRLEDKNMLPPRNFVLSKTGSDSEHQLAMFIVSDYNPELNLFVTLKSAKRKKHEISLVWLQPK